MTDKEERIVEILRRNEGARVFLGIFHDLISNVLFEKKVLN